MSMSRIRSNFSPSRPLQLCFEAACGTSLARDKYTVQSTQKSRRGRIQPVHYVLHECVVGCPILSNMDEHVPIYHLIVLDSTPSYTLCALTSHHRVRCSSGLYQLAKHHSHMTFTPCKALQKSRRGRYSFIYLSVCVIVVIPYRESQELSAQKELICK